MTKAKTIEAWHWLPADKRLQYGDGRKVVVGKPLSCTGDLSLCNRGMHASLKASDSLKYAPGPIICRVRLSGEILTGDDKLCARTRTVLWMADATSALLEHALWCAEQSLPIWRKYYPDDNRPAEAIRIKRLHLAGKATDSELDAAWDAARDAATAWDAAWDAARDAAWAAARAAERAATAWDAARDAARDAERAAAWDAERRGAARDAARAAQESDLTARLMALAPPKAITARITRNSHAPQTNHRHHPNHRPRNGR